MYYSCDANNDGSMYQQLDCLNSDTAGDEMKVVVSALPHLGISRAAIL